MKKLGTVALSIAVFFTLAGAVQAAPIIFFGEDLNPGGIIPPGGNAATARNAFLAMLTGVGTENFEGFAPSAVGPFALSFPGSGGAIGATLTSAAAFICDTTSNCPPPAAGEFPTSGNRWLATPETLNAAFNTPISAFGFFGTDIGDLGATLALTLSNGGVEVLNIPHTTGAGADGALLFFGFVDSMNTYTQVAFGLSGGTGDFFGFDDMTVGDIEQVRVPEPATLLLLGAGLGLVAFRQRRRA